MKSCFLAKTVKDKLIILLQFIITCCLNDPRLLHQRCQFDHHHPTRVDSGTEA